VTSKLRTPQAGIPLDGSAPQTTAPQTTAPQTTVPQTMVRGIRIRDFVTIGELDLELGLGLNVLSGGSGEGKSVLVDALRFGLGVVARGRKSASLVRSGAQEAQVTVRLESSGGTAAGARVMGVLGLDPGLVPATESSIGGASSLQLERTVDKRGRTRARVVFTSDGKSVSRPVAAQALRRLGQRLLQVSEQGAAPHLVEPSVQLDLLDRFGGLAETGGLVWSYAQARGRALELARQRDALLAREEALRSSEDSRRSEREALAELEPEPGEYEELTDRLDDLEDHVERLTRLCHLTDLMVESDETLADRVRSACADLERCSSSGPSQAHVEAARSALEEALAHLDEAGDQLVRAREEEQLEPGEVERLRDRVASYRGLARRLGVTPDALAERWSELQEEDLEQVQAARADAEAALRVVVPALDAVAARLGEARRAAAGLLSEALARELGPLGLGDAKFTVDLRAGGMTGDEEVLPFDPTALRLRARLTAKLEARDPSPWGREEARFLLATNPGAPGLPLGNASGGELSRLFLAIGKVMATHCLESRSVESHSVESRCVESPKHASAPGDRGPASGAPAARPLEADDPCGDLEGLLVFDEVDQGVGARLGAAVADCLYGLGRARQVLAITHLAPVAARADRHLCVVKREGRTRAEVLEGDARLRELALMIKGAPVTEASLQQARELLCEATQRVQSSPATGSSERLSRSRPAAGRRAARPLRKRKPTKRGRVSA
jgi:DNA repair protein RecN (Recombination protein N)